MKLNREQIIKALECCGTSDKSCSSCPLAKDYSSCSKTMADNALTLINELTDENEKLKRELEIVNLQVQCKERICESYMLQYGTVADKEVFLKKERADTIQNLRDHLTTFFANDDHLKYNEVDADYINEQIIRIAMDILEGK